MVHVVHPEKGVQNETNIIFLVQTKYNTQGRNTYIGIRDFWPITECHFFHIDCITISNSISMMCL